MEHTSDTVADGKLLHETTYLDRNVKHSDMEIEAHIEDVVLYGKIDFYDAKRKIVHETKRGNKVEDAHKWQVKFYLWLLQLNGICDAAGVIEYPLLKQTESVVLLEEDCQALRRIVFEVQELRKSENCPPVLKSKICRACSYFDLCYIDEE